VTDQLALDVLVAVLNRDVAGAGLVRGRRKRSRQRGVLDLGGDDDVLTLTDVRPDADRELRIAPQEFFAAHRAIVGS
jgi:hypothetical protein